MSNEYTENSPVTKDTTTLFSPGTNLKRVRESLGLTEEEVAIQLHLSKQVIVDLENDAFDKLPGVIFVRGYLRAYTKLLNTPAEEYIAAFNALHPDAMQTSVTVNRAPLRKRMLLQSKRQNERSILWVGYGIALVLASLVFMWWHSHNNSVDDVRPGTIAKAALVTPSNEAKPDENSSAVSSATIVTETPAQADEALSTTIMGENAVVPGAATTTNTSDLSTPKNSTIDTNNVNGAIATKVAPVNTNQTAKSSVWRNPDHN